MSCWRSTAAAQLTDRYLYGPAVDELLADERVSSLSSAGTNLWTAIDNEGSMRDVWEDGVGLIDHIVYNSFGAITSQTNSYDAPLIGYTGSFTDPDTGLQWHNDPTGKKIGRWYDPKTQQWIGQDPDGLAPDSNPYRYVGNNPTNGTDPSGLYLVVPASEKQIIDRFFGSENVDYTPNNGTFRVTLRDAAAYHLLVYTERTHGDNAYRLFLQSAATSDQNEGSLAELNRRYVADRYPDPAQDFSNRRFIQLPNREQISDRQELEQQGHDMTEEEKQRVLSAIILAKLPPFGLAGDAMAAEGVATAAHHRLLGRAPAAEPIATSIFNLASFAGKRSNHAGAFAGREVPGFGR